MSIVSRVEIISLAFTSKADPATSRRNADMVRVLEFSLGAQIVG